MSGRSIPRFALGREHGRYRCNARQGHDSLFADLAKGLFCCSRCLVRFDFQRESDIAIFHDDIGHHAQIDHASAVRRIVYPAECFEDLVFCDLCHG
jgi:hypothetical protein